MINFLRNKFCLISTIKQLELQVHNQQQVLNTLVKELDILKEQVINKDIELSNLNNYTNELEFKLNQIKILIG